jgi:hypothetical protein
MPATSRYANGAWVDISVKSFYPFETIIPPKVIKISLKSSNSAAVNGVIIVSIFDIKRMMQI